MRTHAAEFGNRWVPKIVPLSCQGRVRGEWRQLLTDCSCVAVFCPLTAWEADTPPPLHWARCMLGPAWWLHSCCLIGFWEEGSCCYCLQRFHLHTVTHAPLLLFITQAILTSHVIKADYELVKSAYKKGNHTCNPHIIIIINIISITSYTIVSQQINWLM